MSNHLLGLESHPTFTIAALQMMPATDFSWAIHDFLYPFWFSLLLFTGVVPYFHYLFFSSCCCWSVYSLFSGFFLPLSHVLFITHSPFFYTILHNSLTFLLHYSLIGSPTVSLLILSPQQRIFRFGFRVVNFCNTDIMDIPLPIDGWNVVSNNLDIFPTSASNGKRYVVLVATGSFNPPTFMHLRMFELARDALRSKGYHVIGAYMSPVNDAYAKKGLLSAEHRIHMCQLACRSSDFVMVDPWEAKQSNYQRTLTVLCRVKNYL
ncbi:uncharacterized protein LOC141634263 isoform X2 [Silene latifolia]|uniref:uncharacterized protein LOC141634263 isoform X2 n=1 Tax=Silene latifolia TaxID=37657 RepID=UPI003D77BCB0